MASPKPLDEIMETAVKAAMYDLSIYLDARFTEEISAVKWSYPTPPQVRDIVDTGRLRASQTRMNTPGGVVFSWPVDYAQQVHEGGVSARTKQPFPGRPWTQEPLAEAQGKFSEYLSNEMRRLQE